MMSGRKNLKRVSGKDVVHLEEGQSIMQVVSLPGSNHVEDILEAKNGLTGEFFIDFPMIPDGVMNHTIYEEVGFLPNLEYAYRFVNGELDPLRRNPDLELMGNFVVVDESGREQALESGSKVACTVTQVLYHNQVRILEKSPDWPESFRRKADDYTAHQSLPVRKKEEDLDSNEEEEEEDDLPPIEANLNRMRPVEVFSESDSD